MAEVRMTMEEYLALTAERPRSEQVKVARTTKSVKRKGKKDPKMAKALERANSMGRKKNGGFKKGWDQAKIMSKAHKLRRKMR